MLGIWKSQTTQLNVINNFIILFVSEAEIETEYGFPCLLKGKKDSTNEIWVQKEWKAARVV
jgi:hypothetical protein